MTAERWDAHVHWLPAAAWAPAGAAWGDPWFASCHGGRPPRYPTPEGLIAVLDAAGIDRAVVSGWPFAAPALLREGNDHIAALVRRFPTRLLGLATVQPADPGCGAELLRAARLGLVGVGELNADGQRFGLEPDGALLELAARCARMGWPMLLHASEPVGHAYPGKGTAGPSRLWPWLERLPERAPGLRLCLAHLGGGLPLYGAMPEVAARCRQLWFDTAAVPFLYRSPVLEAVGAAVGYDRLCFGSDYPLLLPQRYRAALETLAPAARTWVEAGSARAWLLG
ncbi:MAG TPA: amidohydrolase family protein [Candidatus Dormibacteraeota bacterium]|nr:amidohydrolase family protein [Candidatus Dormibacteraeota bacterium]